MGSIMKPNKNHRYPPREVIEKSCGIILYRMKGVNRDYLLLHYPGGHWDFAKGHVESFDTSEEDTARRELKEETGITEVEMKPLYREVMYYEFRRGKSELVKKSVIYFLAEAQHEDVKISFEHKGFVWLPYLKSMKQLTYDNARILLEKAEKLLQNEGNDE